jgi:acetoin utilization deacetylase AcuC-like enzyme
MGFCFFSNAAIAAHYALSFEGINKVGILDWDVHHGNGTQDIVENNPHIAYCSLHQSPCYPGTGKASDHGKSGKVLNIPLDPASDFLVYQRAFTEQVLPFFSEFAPDLLIISAGYDANAADPLASMNLQPQDYAEFSRYAQQISDRLLFGLEGGYDLDALAKSVCATLEPLIMNKIIGA